LGHLKLILLVILATAISTDGYSQFNFANYNLHDQQYQLVYSGCKNKIIIAGLPEIKYAYLTSSGSSVKQLNDSTYILKPLHRLHMDTLKLYIDDELVQQELFMVMPAPTILVQLGEIEVDNVSVKMILKNTYLNLIIDGFYKDYEVVSTFQLNILDKNNAIIKTFALNNTAQLTQKQLEYIKTLKTGHQLEFSEIKVKSAQGITRKKPVYILKIS
jgi:hypothetical protein